MKRLAQSAAATYASSRAARSTCPPPAQKETILLIARRNCGEDELYKSMLISFSTSGGGVGGRQGQ